MTTLTHMTCNNCGQEQRYRSEYCGFCYKSLNGTSAPTSTQTKRSKSGSQKIIGFLDTPGMAEVNGKMMVAAACGYLGALATFLFIQVVNTATKAAIGHEILWVLLGLSTGILFLKSRFCATGLFLLYAFDRVTVLGTIFLKSDNLSLFFFFQVAFYGIILLFLFRGMTSAFTYHHLLKKKLRKLNH